jgi:type I restriction-modification system DNA methylase subunit
MPITDKGAKALAIIEEHFSAKTFTLKELNLKSSDKIHAATLTSLCKNGVLQKGSDSRYIILDNIGVETVLKSEKEGGIKQPQSSVAKLFYLARNVEDRISATLHWMNSDDYGTSPGSMVGIYCIKEIETEKIVYVGKTERPFQQRWQEHKDNLLNGIHHSPKLQKYFNSINKDINKIKFDILQSLPNDSKLIDLRERYWIQENINTILNDMHPSLRMREDVMIKKEKINIENKEGLGLENIVKEVAAEIHEYLYSSIKLSDQDKATLIAGILIALENESFRSSYLSKTDEDYFIEDFMSAIKNSINKFQGLKNGKEAVVSTFDFIKHTHTFKNKTTFEDKTYIALQYLTYIIEITIYKVAKDYPGYDVLGDFYNEFTKYSGADQQSLGIALTPQHIGRFMSELLEVKDNDILLDTCCGTATLLLTADMQTIMPNKIVGVEFNARMLSLAVANVMIRNVESCLLLGDSYSESILTHVATQKPTKLIINPPYSQDGYPELGFLTKGLNLLEMGGKGIIILPISSTIKLDSEIKSLKKELLEKHTLEAIFTMPEKLFYPIGTNTVVMLFTAHVPHSKKSFLGDLREDGFETVKNQGRQDTKNRWSEIKSNMLSYFYNKKETDVSVVEMLTLDNEWNFLAHKKNEFKITKEDFIKKLRAYDKFQNPEKYSIEE